MHEDGSVIQLNLHSYYSSFELHSVNDENKKAGIRNVWGWIKEKKNFNSWQNNGKYVLFLNVCYFKKLALVIVFNMRKQMIVHRFQIYLVYIHLSSKKQRKKLV